MRNTPCEIKGIENGMDWLSVGSDAGGEQRPEKEQQRGLNIDNFKNISQTELQCAISGIFSDVQLSVGQPRFRKIFDTNAGQEQSDANREKSKAGSDATETRETRDSVEQWVKFGFEVKSVRSAFESFQSMSQTEREKFFRSDATKQLEEMTGPKGMFRGDDTVKKALQEMKSGHPEAAQETLQKYAGEFSKRANSLPAQDRPVSQAFAGAFYQLAGEIAYSRGDRSGASNDFKSAMQWSASAEFPTYTRNLAAGAYLSTAEDMGLNEFNKAVLEVRKWCGPGSI